MIGLNIRDRSSIDLSLRRCSACPDRSFTCKKNASSSGRALKQSYNLEDVRAMKYRRLQNLVILVTAVAYFAASFLGRRMKLRILCEKSLIISQRFFGVPPFRFYALADGIRRILSQGTFSPPEMSPASLQLELTLGWHG
jgi:hypothetical protein